MERSRSIGWGVLLLAVGLGAAQPVAAQGPATVEYYHLDAVGSVRAVTSATGSVVRRHDYQPFGGEVPVEPLAGDTVRFAGKQRDPETRLDYFGARYYAERTARFTTVDPVYTWRENLTDPQRWNRYSYVRNNPLRFTDPDGRAIDVIWDAISVGLSAKAVYSDPRSGWNWVALAADVVAAAVPVLPAIGAGIRGGDKVVDAAMTGAAAAKNKSIRWGPHTGAGPLPAEIARTFRSGSYTESVTHETVTLYRVYGGKASELGSFWTRSAPGGPLQSAFDSALNPAWGNTATRVATIRVPAGTRMFEGAAASEAGMLGGGSQVFLPKVDPSWVVRKP